MKKYLALLSAFFKASLTADLEFRFNIIARVVTDVIWYIAQISTFEILFRQTDHLGSWTLGETRVFLGVLFLVDGIHMIFFHDNLERLSEKVTKGELDLLLAKPVNSQFMMSCQRMAPAYIINIILSLVFLIWSYAQLEGEYPWWNLPWLVLLIPAGVLVTYSGRFFFSALCLFFTRAEYLQYMWYQIYRLGMRPDALYFPWLKMILMTVIPVGIIASVPSRAILKPEDPWIFVWSIFVAVLMVYLSTRFWRLALRQYSSASS